MMRIVVALALSIAVAAPAEAQSLSRIYKLCIMEDPDCESMVLQFTHEARRAACPPATGADRPQTLSAAFPDRMLVSRFMFFMQMIPWPQISAATLDQVHKYYVTTLWGANEIRPCRARRSRRHPRQRRGRRQALRHARLMGSASRP